jgi:hypothetical protein
VLLKMPPRPPIVEITRPGPSSSREIGWGSVPYEKPVWFDARVVQSFGTKVIRWEWCFDPENGFHADYSSPDNPSTNVTFPIQKAGEYIDVMLKVFDNESTRRKELFHAGVSYDEFNYDFDPSDGSTYVKLRIHVRYHTDPPPPPPRNYWPFVFLCALVVVLYLGFILAAQRQRLARARRERRK